MNIAIDKTYNQSSRNSIQGPSSNAANGNHTPGTDKRNCIFTTDALGWWEVDLGLNYTISQLRIWGGGTGTDVYLFICLFVCVCCCFLFVCFVNGCHMVNKKNVMVESESYLFWFPFV
jgi:hypothetical protein